MNLYDAIIIVKDTDKLSPSDLSLIALCNNNKLKFVTKSLHDVIAAHFAKTDKAWTYLTTLNKDSEIAYLAGVYQDAFIVVNNVSSDASYILYTSGGIYTEDSNEVITRIKTLKNGSAFVTTSFINEYLNYAFIDHVKKYENQSTDEVILDLANHLYYTIYSSTPDIGKRRIYVAKQYLGRDRRALDNYAESAPVSLVQRLNVDPKSLYEKAYVSLCIMGEIKPIEDDRHYFKDYDKK